VGYPRDLYDLYKSKTKPDFEALEWCVFDGGDIANVVWCADTDFLIIFDGMSFVKSKPASQATTTSSEVEFRLWATIEPSEIDATGIQQVSAFDNSLSIVFHNSTTEGQSLLMYFKNETTNNDVVKRKQGIIDQEKLLEAWGN